MSTQHNGFFLSCDWGTSSFRLSLVDQREYTVVASLSSEMGIKNIRQHKNSGSPFLEYLKTAIDELFNKFGSVLKEIPVLLSGMASSSIGIKELPYASLPFSLSTPRIESEWIDQTEIADHNVLLISGLKSDHDIMRGEETQILGLAASYKFKEATCILPGTHSKHILIRNNAIVDFKTYMTGEVFDLLSSKSILQNSIRSPQTEMDLNLFKAGIGRSQKGDFLHALFSIRANDILEKSSGDNGYDFLSGLVIGTELQQLQRVASDQLFVVGTSGLQKRYATAIEELGLGETRIVDSTDLVAKGHGLILRNLNN